MLAANGVKSVNKAVNPIPQPKITFPPYFAAKYPPIN